MFFTDSDFCRYGRVTPDMLDFINEALLASPYTSLHIC